MAQPEKGAGVADMNEEWIEKCSLTILERNKAEIEASNSYKESINHEQGRFLTYNYEEAIRDGVLRARLAKAIPLISAEARKQERERLADVMQTSLEWDLGRLISWCKALKEGGKEAE